MYTFGTAGYNYNDYNRTGGALGADVNGSYWGRLGYRSSGLLNYGVYGNAAYASGAGYLNNNQSVGIGAGFYGGVMGGLKKKKKKKKKIWVLGDVTGKVSTTAGELYKRFL